ncbi:HPF/RaiA family ribosome-associated protein [Paraglaciecola aquimarina]|uniref:HPF/RaiA family ribosome-associated protein n=1 Tax=Paraglaciecola algarum TaxID=3050085 RepID=A0ABS9D2A4_9ALTE|nr:HPF/RaiA family ribosome-associated protein [Paraglaciecola sp. G1-23]MCF2947052.1 HPF/RaiA family ribosome-associated protein [Paraglaciecola sp. G1-23]
MIIDIQARQFALSKALKHYVESKLSLNLGRYKANINRINVSLFDVNGPKGGEDKCCKTIIKVKGMSTIVIEETTLDMYDAINKCLNRAKRTVSRSVSFSSWKRQKPVPIADNAIAAQLTDRELLINR